MMRKLIVAIFVPALMLLLAVTMVQAQLQAYIVQPGETLPSIAAQFNVTVNEILAVNSIPNPNQLFVGQVVFIPLPSSPSPAPTIVPVIPSVPPPSVSPPQTDSFGQQIYIVERGDTLTRIAARFGVPTGEIIRENSIFNPNLIFAGQQIVIPSIGGPITPQPTAPVPPPSLSPPPPPTNGLVAPGNTIPYIVKRGDTLSGIALDFLVGLEGLRLQNGIVDNRRIFPNQVLFIPQPGNPFYLPYYDPYSGQPTPTIGQPLAPVTSDAQFYVVQPGDTLPDIAERFGVDLWDLARANNILNLSVVSVGQSLQIP